MFFEYTIPLYRAFLEERPVVEVPAEHADITKAVIQKIGWNTRVRGVDVHGVHVGKMKENNKIMVALSGGLDSVYLMNKLIEQGYDVEAVHVEGLNKSSSNYEERAAHNAAKEAGVKYIRAEYKAPKQHFPDNPFKNQLVLSMLLDIGINRGIYRYAVGSDWTTPLSEAVVGFTITDSEEVYHAYWDSIKAHFPQAELVFIPDNEKKIDRLTYLFDADKLKHVSSCVSPFRFRASLHEKNEQKYGIKLMNGRCGSCYKCAMEYILLVETGRLPKNDAFYAHSWDTLATSKTAHRPDLFDKKLPMSKRMENLKNYGS